MSPTRKRLLLLVLSVPVLVVGAALLYMLGMGWLEGQPRSFWEALNWASETLTTTGYGSDARWRHPLMVLLVMVTQWVGVFLVFLVVPVFLIPYLEERFEARLPTRALDLSDHVVIFRSGATVTTLLQRLSEAGVASLVIEPDELEARRLVERGQRVMLAQLGSEALVGANLGAARALIANGTDAENAVVLLAARQLGFLGELIALAEEPLHRKPLALAGAASVFTPRHVLGAALAARASARLGPRVAGVHTLGRLLRVDEVRIRPGSSLAGRTLAEADVRGRTGVSLIARWREGRLEAPLSGQSRLAAGEIVVAIGREESLLELERQAGGIDAARRQGRILVAGYGEVGRTVAELLRGVGEEVGVLGRHAEPGVDIVGDVLHPPTLEAANLPSVRALVLALDSDSATLFATVIARDLAPDLPIIARVNQGENVERIYRAGADFALSISQVAGQILAHRLLGQEAVEVDTSLELAQLGCDSLVDRRPGDLDLHQRTGCTLVAVERGEELLVDLGGAFRFSAGDRLFVTGSRAAVARFREAFPAGEPVRAQAPPA